MANPTRVFVSYSWDDEPHKAWVARLARDLRRDGVEPGWIGGTRNWGTPWPRSCSGRFATTTVW